MMSEAGHTAKKVCGAMLAGHAKRAKYIHSGEADKYQLKDTVKVECHHDDILSRHRQQSRYLPGVVLRKTTQDVYVIQLGNKTMERDHTQLFPQHPDTHGHAVTFEVTADDFDSHNDGQEDKYTTERIISDKPALNTLEGWLYKVQWKGFAA